MKSAVRALLGPQFHEPTVGAVLEELGVTGKVATITAGWQELEGEDDALMRQLDGRGLPLLLHGRAERVWAADPELMDAHRAMQADLRTLRSLYNVRLEPAAQAWFRLLESEAPERILEAERDSAVEAIQRLDAHLLRRVSELRADFERRMRPLERDAVAKERGELAELLSRVTTVVIEGGHVAVLLNRIALFGLRALLAEKTLIGCAGGAMALCSRLVLYNDAPAVGKGHSEVALPGLGLAPGVVALPDASARLRIDDPERMQRLALRLAPERCVVLDPRARLVWDGSSWSGTEASVVLEDGTLQAWGRAA